MKNRTRIAAASLAATAALVAVPSAANANHSPDVDGDHRPCVTNREFHRVDVDDSKTWAKQVFDTRGTHVDGAVADQVYSDLAGYGIRLPRLQAKYREVRVYDVCLDGNLISGSVTSVFDTRGHRLVIAEMFTTGFAGRSAAFRR